MTDPLPTRVVRLDEARHLYPELVATLLPALSRTDELADRVVTELADFEPQARERALERALDGVEFATPALRAYREATRGLPEFADRARMERAAVVFRRSGVLGGVTLGLMSLVHGYAAPAGNKPLALSGQLTERAARRLAETTRFVTAISEPGGLEDGGAGHRATLRVRLMHAQVRRLISRSGRWDAAAWGAPINQHDMLATVLLFSSVFLRGLTRLGFRLEQGEREDFQHLWRVVGERMGVELELLPSSHAAAERASEFIHLTQGPPDEDSRRLVRALLDAPLAAAHDPESRRRARVATRVSEGLCRGLVGDELADRLGLERSWHRRIVDAVAGTLSALEALRVRIPGLEPFVELLGRSYWEQSLRRGLGASPARFSLPERLLSGRPGSARLSRPSSR